AVVLDNFTAGVMLVEHLYTQGYRRIVGLFGNASTTGVERYDGYLTAIRRFGLTPETHFIPPTVSAAEAIIQGWFATGTAPQAVIASNSLLLMGVIRAMRAADKQTPEDMAVAGFDNETWTELTGPGLTVIEQPIANIGRTAMQLLLARLEAPDAPVRKVVLGGRCVVRGSTRALAPA
ncbi:MAG: LacI family transcriptional regulator, partial [Acidocella sp. 20-63-7]